MKTKLKRIFTYSLLGAVAAASSAGPLADAAQAEVFHSPRELLASRFGRSERVRFVHVAPAAQERRAIEQRLGRRLAKDRYTFYVATSGERVDGYALFDEERGQHEDIDLATFFDARGRITDVVVIAYREPHGDGIRSSRFRRQFVGRHAASGFRTGRDLDGVSGSTISARSMARAAERASVLLAATLLAEGDPGALARR